MGEKLGMVIWKQYLDQSGLKRAADDAELADGDVDEEWSMQKEMEAISEQSVFGEWLEGKPKIATEEQPIDKELAE